MCSVDGCERRVVARGWCGLHYKRWKRNGDPELRIRTAQGAVCGAEGCDRPPLAHGFCSMHVRRWLKHGDATVVKKGGRKRTRPERALVAACIVCGAVFELPRKPGRPPVCCSDGRRVLNHRLRAKAWFGANPERAALQPSRQPAHRKRTFRAYYEANREREIARSLAYARGPGREAKRAADAARFALTRGAPNAERFTLDEIFARDSGVCHLCGLAVDRRVATMDHVIPVTKGGPHTRANVKLAHRSCNTRKGNRLLAA